MCTPEQSTAPAALFNNLIYFQTEFPNNVDIDLDEILEIEDENQEKSDGNKHEVILEKTIDNNIPTLLDDEILQPELRVSRI